jgi:hypothetical protein
MARIYELFVELVSAGRILLGFSQTTYGNSIVCSFDHSSGVIDAVSASGYFR